MKVHAAMTAAFAVCALSFTTSPALAHDGGSGGNQRRIDTQADFTPFKRFQPLGASAPCPGAPGGQAADPYLLPSGGKEGPARYDQGVFFEESDPLTPQPPAGTTTEPQDAFDMNTQNETGKDAGRYVYRTHESSGTQANGSPGGQLTVTDLTTGRSKNIAQRADWESFDGVVWTPWGTILGAEEAQAQGKKDPQVPQAVGGLVYEFFLDLDDPTRLDPSREPMNTDDGTNDTVQDGIRARPALGAKAHEGMRFDKRGYLYSTAESRGETMSDPTAPVDGTTPSGGLFRFEPDHKGDLSSGTLSAYDSPNGKDGSGRWQPLDRAAVQVDADKYAASQGVNRYQRPEDVETDQSTGVDRNNNGNTVYVAITEDGLDQSREEGVFALDVTNPNRPFGYRYVNDTLTGTIADPRPGNVKPGDFTNPDNVALDGQGNLAITEDTDTAANGGDDIFIAAPPRTGNGGKDHDGRQGGNRHEPASTVQRFASLKDCAAEGSGIYFAMAGTERYTRSNPNPEVRALLTGRSLLVNRQHAGQTSPFDQGLVIAPVGEPRGHDGHDGDKGDKGHKG